jgi:dTDP-4-amino-4,6-dideoxygalactose transaminase
MIGREEREAVLRVLDSGVLSGFQGNWSEAFYGGPEIRSLEKEWASYFGVKHAITCNSATSGLFLACAAIGLKPPTTELWEGSYRLIESEAYDEVICTPWSMTCSASIPLHFGAKPVFADIEPDYYCLDPASVEAAITERTKAIIVVDLFGQPYAVDEINAIAKKHGIMVIEDAAQAIGAKYKGKYAGTLGDIGVFSLNTHKHIQCGEGGVVTTDNDELAFKIRLLCNHAEAVYNDIARQHELDRFNESIASLIGMNMRMTELQAAIAREQLKKLEGILQTVREHAKYFPVKVRPGCEHAYYRYAYKGNEKTKNYVANYGNQVLGFHYIAKNHYITPLYKMPLFQALGYQDGLCPVCEEVEENIVLAWLKETP